MSVYVRFNYYGWIKAIYMDFEKATRECEDGDYVETWKVV